ncbi:MAG: ATP-dependent Clp protease adaptor ClpS [Saprospiraceae bacterium]
MVEHTEVIEEVLLQDHLDDIDTGEPAVLIVYNDEINTFEWVIDTFVEILQHTQEQSEQLAYLIHFKGKATVKTAPKSVLRPLRTALVDRGLNAVVEDLV